MENSPKHMIVSIMCGGSYVQGFFSKNKSQHKSCYVAAEFSTMFTAVTAWLFGIAKCPIVVLSGSSSESASVFPIHRSVARGRHEELLYRLYHVYYPILQIWVV